MKRRPPALDEPHRKHRSLTQEESRLWLEEMGERIAEILERETVPVRVKSAAPAKKTFQAGKQPPEPQAVDAHTRRKIVRGRVKIEATLDLHGHHRAPAHAELVRFIERAQAKGISLVLVITGKGRDGKPRVLREELPRWLAAPPLQGAIIAYDTAGSAHGGEGAWYVRIRKRRTT